MTKSRSDGSAVPRGRKAAGRGENGSGQPMYNLECEEAVLGSLLIDADAWTKAASLLDGDDFYHPANRIIFGAIAELARQEKARDAVTVAEVLERDGHLQAIGGLAYLSGLARETPSAANVGTYAQAVREKSCLRQLEQLGPQIASAVADGANVDHLVTRITSTMERICRPNNREGPSVQLTAIDFARMQPLLADGQVVKGLIGRGSLVAAIGATGSGKTFFGTDLGLHIAAKRPWRGLTVHGGLVVYTALEGPGSAVNRLVAARQAGGFPAGIPLRLTPGPVSLRAPADVQLLIEFVRQAERDHGEKCAVVFIDTVSRAIAGGDENTSEDMGALIAGADAVRLATGATVFLVHHLGKDESRGARGHSSLKAALDTEIELAVKPDGLHVATVTKQRDLPGGAQFAFRLKVVELGRDSDDDPVTSCIVEHVHDVPVERRAPRGKNQEALLSALTEWRRQHPDSELISTVELQQIARSQKLDRSRRREAIEKLNEYGYLTPCTGGYRVLSEDSR